jgi:hypothetical protein
MKYVSQSKLIYVCQLYLHAKTLEFNNKHVWTYYCTLISKWLNYIDVDNIIDGMTGVNEWRNV